MSLWQNVSNAHWLRLRGRYAERGELLVLVVVVVSLSFSIVYANVQSFDPQLTSSRGLWESNEYLKMYFGEPGTGARRYRPLVPFVARLMPDLSASLFTPGRRFDPVTVVLLKFAVINLFFLVSSCVVLYFLQRGFGFGFFTAFLGVLLFLSSQAVIRTAGLPTADMAFFFFFLLCIVSIQHDAPWMLLFAHTIGVLAKELSILTLPLILLSALSWRRKRWMLMAILPGITLYVVMHVTLAPSPLDDYATQDLIARVQHGGVMKLFSHLDDQLLALTTVNGIIRLMLSFGIAWIPALYALIFCDVPLTLKRWSWLLVIVIGVVLLTGESLGSGTFTAFPVVLPLAAVGLNSCLYARRRESCKKIDSE